MTARTTDGLGPTTGYHVLVVDDEAIVRDSLAALLEARYWVTTVGSAEEAREVLQDADVSVVVADEHLPGASGVDLLSWAYRHRPGVVRMLLTGYAEPDTIIRAINDARIFHYVRKPWDNTELMNLLERGLELRESRAALERSERVYRELFHHALVGIARFDPKGTLLDANKAFCRSLGLDPETLVDQDFAELCVEPGAFRALLEQLRVERSLSGLEIAVRKGGGQVGHLLFSASLRSAAGGSEIIEATALDQTEQRQAALESEDLREQLSRVQRQASLYTLSTGLVHDLNNQLTIILSSAGYIRERLSGADGIDDAAADIEQASADAGDLTQQLVVLAREQGGARYPTDVNAVVGRIARLLTHSVRPIHRVDLRLAKNLPVVQGNAARLGHAILNLGLNGIEAMPDGGTLRLTTRPGVDESGRTTVEVVVADEGTGMTPEVVERIFEPYFTTRQRAGGIGGVGLGLTMVRSVVVQHDGAIEVETAPGQGSTFLVRLPAFDPDERERAAPPQIGLKGSGAVLLADDEPGIRRRVGQLFVDGGFTVVKAETGVEAIAQVQAHPELRLVVLDLVMPAMGGEEAFAAIRALRPDLPVLFITPHLATTELGGALEEPRTGLLRKPFTPYDLAAAVASLLRA